MKVRTKVVLTRGAEILLPGREIEIPDEEARALIGRDLVEPLEGARKGAKKRR